MTQDEYRKQFEAIEAECVAGRMSISGALARVALLSLEYQRRNAREANLTREAFEWKVNR